MGTKNGARRRSAAEWAELIESLEESGLGAAAFARSRGIDSFGSFGSWTGGIARMK
jgi:hypothetical protein